MCFGYIFLGCPSLCSQVFLVENEFTSSGTLTENKCCGNKCILGKKWGNWGVRKTMASRLKNLLRGTQQWWGHGWSFWWNWNIISTWLTTHKSGIARDFPTNCRQLHCEVPPYLTTLPMYYPREWPQSHMTSISLVSLTSSSSLRGTVLWRRNSYTTPTNKSDVMRMKASVISHSSGVSSYVTLWMGLSASRSMENTHYCSLLPCCAFFLINWHWRWIIFLSFFLSFTEKVLCWWIKSEICILWL